MAKAGLTSLRKEDVQGLLADTASEKLCAENTGLHFHHICTLSSKD